jgi:lysophospholipase L1-like esterase
MTGFSQPVSERRTRDARPVDDNPHATLGRPNDKESILRAPPRQLACVADVGGGIKSILATLQEQAPGATIALTALFPRPQDRELAPAIGQINEQPAKLADGKKIRFVNINDRLTGAKGDLLPGVPRDRLHLEEKGDDAWADALKPILAELLGPAGETDDAPPPAGDPSAARREPDLGGGG